MAKREYTEDELEAMELVDAIYDFAADHDWELSKSGVNKQFAWARLERGDESLQVFYAINQGTDDKFIFGSQTIDKDAIRGLVMTRPEADLEAEMAEVGAKIASGELTVDADGEAVPPTSAAHQEAVPPTDDSAAHQAEDSAAHSEPVEEEDAAHIAREAQGHIADADDKGVDTYNQSGVYGAVMDQQNEERNWSKLCSPMNEAELLKRVLGREITWRNSFSGRWDTAVVSTKKAAENHPAHVTPAGYDPEETGEDMRILHFLEVGAGFKSVAVARIVRIK
jgi:hypothetical protein